MPKRMSLFAPAAVSLLAALAAGLLTTRSSLAQSAPDDCVTRPGSTAPQGNHWYYHYDRANGRHCWFLGPEGAKAVSAPHRTPASVLRLPSPRPPLIDAGADAFASVEPVAPMGERPAGGAAFGDAAASFSQRWPRAAVSPSAVARERVALADGTPTSRDALGAGANAEEPAAADGQDGLPLVWPILTADERAAARTQYESMPTLDRLLAILAAVLALIAIAGQAVARLSAAKADRAQPATASPTSAAGRRARPASAGAAREYVRNPPHAEMRGSAPVRRFLSRG